MATRDASSPPRPADGMAAGPGAAALLETMREDVLACRLTPGARLKARELQQRYAASTGALRGVMAELAAEGLVIGEVNRGFTVAAVSVADFLDLTELRVDLELKALAGSIRYGGDDWEARVISAFHMLQKLQPPVLVDRDAEESLWSQRHRAFHEALVSACPSPWLLRFRRTLFSQARRYHAVVTRHRATPERIEQHRRLMDAALTRNGPGAAALCEAHIRDTIDTVLANLDGDLVAMDARRSRGPVTSS